MYRKIKRISFLFLFIEILFVFLIYLGWVPAMFTSGYEDYTNHICYITNTYYVNQTQKIPSTRTERQSLQLLYYQWIPFILCFLR